MFLFEEKRISEFCSNAIKCFIFYTYDNIKIKKGYLFIKYMIPFNTNSSEHQIKSSFIFASGFFAYSLFVVK